MKRCRAALVIFWSTKTEQRARVMTYSNTKAAVHYIATWLIFLLMVCASTTCVADSVVFTNGDASHIVNGQAITSVLEGSQFTVSGATTLTSMDFNFFTYINGSALADSVSWWIYSADPKTAIAATAQGTASINSTYLGNVLVGNYYADYTGTIRFPNISLGAGSYYVVLGDATKGGSSATTYWASDSIYGGQSVSWKDSPAPNGTWTDNTIDFIFDVNGTPTVPEPSSMILMISALPLLLGVRWRAQR